MLGLMLRRTHEQIVRNVEALYRNEAARAEGFNVEAQRLSRALAEADHRTSELARRAVQFGQKAAAAQEQVGVATARAFDLTERVEALEARVRELDAERERATSALAASRAVQASLDAQLAAARQGERTWRELAQGQQATLAELQARLLPPAPEVGEVEQPPSVDAADRDAAARAREVVRG